MASQHKTSRRRRRVVRRHRSSAPSWAERVLGHRFKRIFWWGGLVAALVYGYIFFKYVAPYTASWKALYGELSFPKGYEIHGLDVSHHQGCIDWEEVARAKVGGHDIEFVIVKATEGSSLLDKQFRRNFREAREEGLIRGAYHFYRPTSSGEEQARHFMNKVHLEPGDLPPVLDIEVKGKQSTEELQREALIWLRLLERRYGVPPIIYTGLKFKQDYLNAESFERYPFWIAHYYVDSLRYEGVWKFWQHTDLGHVRGIRGDVDLNIYNGSMYDLRRLTIPKSE